MREEDRDAVLDALESIDRVMGLLSVGRAARAVDDDVAGWVEAKIAERTAARAAKDFTTSDAIRDELADRGIVLEDGEIPTSAGQLHVDCSASAISNTETKPIFQGDLITPQMVRSYQPVFSAAFIGHIEARFDDDKEKNRLCGVVPLPNHDTDYLHFTAAFMLNQYNWGQDDELRDWLRNNRLDGFSKMVSEIDEDDQEKRDVMRRLRKASMPAAMKLQQFIQQLGAG